MDMDMICIWSGSGYGYDIDMDMIWIWIQDPGCRVLDPGAIQPTGICKRRTVPLPPLFNVGNDDLVHGSLALGHTLPTLKRGEGGSIAVYELLAS